MSSSPADLPHLARWLARAALLITQPIRDDYRGLPLGSSQLGETGSAPAPRPCGCR